MGMQYSEEEFIILSNLAILPKTISALLHKSDTHALSEPLQYTLCCQRRRCATCRHSLLKPTLILLRLAQVLLQQGGSSIGVRGLQDEELEVGQDNLAFMQGVPGLVLDVPRPFLEVLQGACSLTVELLEGLPGVAVEVL